MTEESMSPGEVGRTLARIDANVRHLQANFDGWREILIGLQHRVDSNTEDIAALNKERDAEREKADRERLRAEDARKTDRRLIFTALAAPIIILVVNYVIQIFAISGGGSP